MYLFKHLIDTIAIDQLGLQFLVGNSHRYQEISHNPLGLFKNFSFDAPFHGQINFQDSASLQMDAITDFHHDLMSYLSFILIFVTTMLYFTITLFRENNKYPFYQLFKAYYQNLTHHTVLEIIWTVIPALLIGKIALASFALIYMLDYMDSPQLNFIVTGNQWYWTYEVHPLIKDCPEVFDIQFNSSIIPAEDLKLGEFRLLEVDRELVVPYNVALSFEFTSNDVIHSWTVPSLGIHADCIPGRTNYVKLIITQPGTFYGQSCSTCSSAHGFMPIKVVAVDTTMWYFWMFCMAEKNNNFYKNLFFLAVQYPDVFFDTSDFNFKKKK
jgi:cytochrome c oxidase subunit 2